MPTPTLPAITPDDLDTLTTNLEHARTHWADAIGTDSIAIRADLGLSIIYASTTTHALEARISATGETFRYRINGTWYNTPDEIPHNLRKLRALATRIHNNGPAASTAYTANLLHTLAYRATDPYRTPEDRAYHHAAYIRNTAA